MNRRFFLSGLVSALSAPAIVHAGNIMKVRAIVLPDLLTYGGEIIRWEGSYFVERVYHTTWTGMIEWAEVENNVLTFDKNGALSRVIRGIHL